MGSCKKYSKKNINSPKQLHKPCSQHLEDIAKRRQTTRPKTIRTSQSRRRQPIPNRQTRSRNHRLILHQSKNHLRRARTLRIQNQNSSRKNPPQRSHQRPKRRANLKSRKNNEGTWYSQIPVFDGKQSVGSISEKAILRQILAGKDLEEISKLPTEDIMEEAFPQINEDAPLSLISSLLQTYSAVLVSKKGAVIGIITKADLLRML